MREGASGGGAIVQAPTFAEVYDRLREEWEALGLLSYHGTSWGWAADLSRDDIEKIRALLREAAGKIEGAVVTTMRAVVRYPVDATPGEKVRELRDGLNDVAMELVQLGCTLGQVMQWLEDAAAYAEAEAAAMENQDG